MKHVARSISAVQRLDQIRAPTLIIVGEHELPDFHAIAAKLEQIPDSTRVVVRCGHVVPMEASDHFNELVLGFYQEVDKGILS